MVPVLGACFFLVVSVLWSVYLIHFSADKVTLAYEILKILKMTRFLSFLEHYIFCELPKT